MKLFLWRMSCFVGLSSPLPEPQIIRMTAEVGFVHTQPPGRAKTAARRQPRLASPALRWTSSENRVTNCPLLSNMVRKASWKPVPQSDDNHYWWQPVTSCCPELPYFPEAPWGEQKICKLPGRQTRGSGNDKVRAGMKTCFPSRLLVR